jgi:UDP-N-acetylglucosamine--N-acetylmuramyl-(pentapeptide) pyrophosphoryl-undecaprenol N-acetylglucosamine transferase
MPGIAVARELMRRHPEARILFVGAERGIEKRVVPQLGFELVTLEVGGFKRTAWWDRVRNALALARALVRSFVLLLRFRPDVVVGLGGYASFPMMAAATLCGRPRVVMEQNVHPGLANRLAGRWADFVAVPDERARLSFPRQGVVTGNPVREEFKSIPVKIPRSPFTVLVTGGSQGAESINRAVVEALPHLAEWVEGLRFVHQAGARQVEMIRAAYREAGFTAEVESFFVDLHQRYAEADLVICRAGATTVAELRAAGRASIMIPLPGAADDHQRKNARSMVDADAGVMIDPLELDGQRLAREVIRLLETPRRIEEIARNARRTAVSDAEARIADLIDRAVHGVPAGGVDVR